jgi:hypothetical protein
VLDLHRGGGTVPDRLRLKAIAAVDGGPAALLPALALIALFVGVAGLLLLGLGSAPGAQPISNRVAKWCLVALIAAAVAGLGLHRALRRRARTEPGLGSAARELPTAMALALAALLPVLLLPIHYMAARTHPTPLHWNGYGFLDKRWLTTSFLILTAGSALLLAVAARIVGTARLHPESWREWLRHIASGRREGDGGAPPESGTGAARPWLAPLLKLACAVVVATYFFGPPWHLPATPIDYHETNTLGGVQAIRTGSLPYLDSAAVQYGPGAQVLNYVYATATGHFSVDGFRQVTLIFNWLAAMLFLGALYLRVRPLVAAVTTLAAVTLFPTLQIFGVDAKGFVDGFWGWGNTLRYAAVFVLAMLFPAVIARAEAGGSTRLRSIALGAVWALLCLVAQENLIGGAMLLGVMAVLLVATASAARQAVVSCLAGVGAGFLLVVLPVFGFYLAHGRLGRFLELYWLVPQAVASGYSNTTFPNAKWSPLFYGLPLLLGALLLLSLIAGRPFRVATRWSQTRVVLVSALVAAVISHLGALTRSDMPHLENTELALPAALCLAAFYLPELLGGASRRWRWAGGLAIAAVTLALLPLAPYSSQPKQVALKLWRPLHARVNPPPRKRVPATIPRGSVAAARIGSAILPAKRCCTKQPVPMPALVRFMDRLHTVVGRRRVYVDRVSDLTVVPPAVYFLADLRPATTPQEHGTMVLNTRMRAEFFRYFRAHIQGVQAVVTTDFHRRAPTQWAAAFPKHRTVSLPFGRRTVHVLMR